MDYFLHRTANTVRKCHYSRNFRTKICIAAQNCTAPPFMMGGTNENLEEILKLIQEMLQALGIILGSYRRHARR
jgi:hypothetical protein